MINLYFLFHNGQACFHVVYATKILSIEPHIMKFQKIWIHGSPRSGFRTICFVMCSEKISGFQYILIGSNNKTSHRVLVAMWRISNEPQQLGLSSIFILFLLTSKVDIQYDEGGGIMAKTQFWQAFFCIIWQFLTVELVYKT